uniref:ATP synthase F0 subunit 8 n=1 Tax=Rhynchospio aff. asiatica ZW-2021 TaxID=2813871 RepID=UPI0023AA53DF|nr:ATP synthase F0 subunit 8 [Rhynchospio aff. asiatica ZW-2021]WCI21137.1 ATP synthase F0 subunit 8 [Rhynchospio aff. asiatica ZW-2021]
MPHLAPLAWATAPITFWLIMMLFSSIIWWSQGIQFPSYTASSKSTFSLWQWA